MMISNVFMLLTRSITSASRIQEVLDEPEDITDRESAAACPPVKDGSIDFEQVSFKYSDSAQEYVLSDINLSIAAGETIGIVGGTGSAKTSLVSSFPVCTT